VVFYCHSKVDHSCATFKTFKYYLFYASVLAHEDVMVYLMSSKRLSLFHQMSMESVLILICKELVPTKKKKKGPSPWFEIDGGPPRIRLAMVWERKGGGGRGVP